MVIRWESSFKSARNGHLKKKERDGGENARKPNESNAYIRGNNNVKEKKLS